MDKITLTFRELDEEKAKALLSYQDAMGAIDDIRNMLRKTWKYEDLGTEAQETMDRMYEGFFAIMEDRGFEQCLGWG